MTERHILPSPQSVKSPTQTKNKNWSQRLEEKENENTGVVRELKFNDKLGKSLGENQTTNFTDRQQSKRSLENKKEVLREIFPNDPKINHNTEGEQQKFPVKIPVEQFASKKNHLTSDRAPQQRKSSAARTPKSTKNSKENSNNLNAQKNFSSKTPSNKNFARSKPSSTKASQKGTRNVVSKREFYEEFGLPEKMLNISDLIDNIVEQKILTVGVDKVNPKLLMNEVRSQVSSILESEGLLAAFEKDKQISVSKSFQSQGGIISPSIVDQKSFHSGQGMASKLQNQAKRSNSRQQKEKTSTQSQSQVTESAEKARSKNEIIENANKLVNENLRRNRELSLQRKEEQEKQRQESEERKIKIAELNEQIKNKNKRKTSGSPSNHRCAWGADQVKLEKRPEVKKGKPKKKLMKKIVGSSWVLIALMAWMQNL